MSTALLRWRTQVTMSTSYTYFIDFTDASVPLKTRFIVPEYKTEGTINPLSLMLNGGEHGATSASTSLLLIGKGVPNYGERIQENLVHLLENFASNGISPVYPTIGQLWYDYSTKTLQVYRDVSTWEQLVGTSGGTMLGHLTLSGSPVEPLHATTKQYVDTVGSQFVQKIGDTMSGPLFLSEDPTIPHQAATKDYVDTVGSQFVQKIGDTMSGPLFLSGAPTDPLHATNKQYVDTIPHITDTSIHVTTAVNSLLNGLSPTLTSVELNHVQGVTSAIQQQLNDKASTSHSHYLSSLSDVDISLLSNGDSLVWDGGDSKWKPVTVSGGGSDFYVTSGTLNTVTGELVLVRAGLSNVIIPNIGAKIHEHLSSDVSHEIVSVTGDLFNVWGASTIPVSDVIDTLDTTKASKTELVDSTTIIRSIVTSSGQTLFTTPEYTIGSNKLWVFVNGVKAYEGTSESYNETTTTSITFTYIVPAGTKVEFLVFGA